MTIRIGFVGCGNHASTNLYPALRWADCELVAVADTWAERREVIRRTYHPAAVHADWRPLLAAGALDAVLVCGPAGLHHEVGIAALEAGLPVFLEKPPAPDSAGTAALAAAAKRGGALCMVAFMKRFARQYRRAAAIAADPAFGGLMHCHMTYGYRMGGVTPLTALHVMGIHAIDLVRHFCGEPVTIHVERTEQGGAYGFHLLCRFAGGHTAAIDMDGTCAGINERLVLVGGNARVVVEEVTTLVHQQAPDKAWQPLDALLAQPNMALQVDDNASGELQGYRGEICEFISAVAERRQPRCATIDDAVAAMRWCDAIAACPSGTISGAVAAVARATAGSAS